MTAGIVMIVIGIVGVIGTIVIQIVLSRVFTRQRKQFLDEMEK